MNPVKNWYFDYNSFKNPDSQVRYNILEEEEKVAKHKTLYRHYYSRECQDKRMVFSYDLMSFRILRRLEVC